jgi:hypothetical protein
VVTSKLTLVYIAIGISGVALLALGIGAAVNWRELTGKPTTAAAEASAPGPAQVPEAAARETPARETAARETAARETAARETPARKAAVPAAAGVAAATGSGWPAAVPATPSAPSRAGYLPTGQRQQANPVPARPAAPADPFPPAVQAQPAAQAPAAFTSRREPPGRDAAREIWEWREDSVQAPPPSRPQGPPQGPPQAAAASAAASAAPGAFSPFRAAGRAASPGGEEGPEQPPAAPRERPPDTSPPQRARPQSEDGPPSEDQPSAQDQPPADHPEQAEPAATASDPESATIMATVSAADAAASPRAEESKQPGPAKEPDPVGPDPNAEVTVVPGVPRYHNARCILIRFMGENDLDKMTRAAAREAGCTPCRACLPDQSDKSPE